MGMTTIQVSHELLEKLKQRKLYDKESYEEVIWDALEDSEAVSDETKRLIEEGEADVRAGRVYELEDVKRELGL